MKVSTILKLAIPLAAGALAASAAPQERLPEFALPIDCKFGEACIIQQYLDHDAGPGAKDYRCGPMSYDGHDGVDVRVATTAEQKKGVTVLAAAAGTVREISDGMDDINFRLIDLDSIKGRDCGNGVVIAHEGGWETAYCHLAKGSVRVRQGQEVAAGAPLGLVGMSGKSEIWALHFVVRRHGETVDPFAYGAEPAACSGGKSLWSKAAQATLAYHSPDLLNSGFATGALTMDDIESGRAASIVVAANSPWLVAYVRAIGLKSGDVESLALINPQGVVLAEKEQTPLLRDRAQQIRYVGRRLRLHEWPSGTYVALYTVKREGVPLYSHKFTLTLP